LILRFGLSGELEEAEVAGAPTEFARDYTLTAERILQAAYPGPA
jgi:hypothetical protein